MALGEAAAATADFGRAAACRSPAACSPWRSAPRSPAEASESKGSAASIETFRCGIPRRREVSNWRCRAHLQPKLRHLRRTIIQRPPPLKAATDAPRAAGSRARAGAGGARAGRAAGAAPRARARPAHPAAAAQPAARAAQRTAATRLTASIRPVVGVLVAVLVARALVAAGAMARSGHVDLETKESKSRTKD